MKITQLSELEHVLLRPSTYIGSIEKQTQELFVFKDGKFSLEPVRFTPGWFKIVDEIVVNAIDHWVRFPKKVKTIQIEITDEGIIAVENDGPTIPIEKTKNIAGETMYSAQMACSELRSGSNFDEKEERIVGGMNGIGMKATNAFSKWFRFTTCDGSNHLELGFEENLSIKLKPKLTKVKSKSFTRVEFLPDYGRLGYPEITKDDYQSLHCLVQTRAIQASVCTTAQIVFNHLPVQVNYTQFIQMFIAEEPFFTATIKGDGIQNGGNPVELSVAVSDGMFRQSTLINGIYCYKGGSVVNVFRKQISLFLKEKLSAEVSKFDKEAKVSTTNIQNALFIFVKASVINPQFNSQSKEELTTSDDKFSKYTLTHRQLEQIWQLFKDHLLGQFIRKIRDKDNTRRTKPDNIDKYSPARKAGSKSQWMRTTLFICEGDSASGAAKTGITSQSTPIDWDFFGIYSIQGVPPNSRKMTSEQCINGETHVIKTVKLGSNKRLNDLMTILGLSYNKQYAPTPEGDAEFSTLRYGCVAILVDQDLDGFNICGLLLSYFHQMWPDLFKRNYFKKLDTPIIRVYRDKQRRALEHEFYTVPEYNHWEKQQGGSDKLPSAWNVVYYKGLASHSPQETARLFMNYSDKVLKFSTDEKSEETIEVYYGRDSDKRKHVLKTPEEQLQKRITVVPLPVMMHTMVKPAQRYNILRKLIHVCDGMTIAKRKVLCTARHVFKSNNTAQRVSTFSGQVQSFAHYHHGEMSLNKTIIGMAQCFRGGKHIPMLYPEGNFGNYFNPNKAGSPRYVATRLNKAICFALYPERDDPILNYEFDEGHRCEPLYYVPVLPTALLEHVSIPGTGWACRVWARAFEIVATKTKSMIQSDGELTDEQLKMPVWKDHSDMKLVKYNGTVYSVGKYSIEKVGSVETIIITDLPLRIFTEQFIGEPSDSASICNFPEVAGIPIDNSLANGSKVHIEISLKPNALAEIRSKYGIWKNPDDPSEGYAFDPIEHRFRLRVALNSSLNLIHLDKSILECTKYSEIMRIWFKERRRLYHVRVERELTLLYLKKQYLKNILRFLKKHETYQLSKATREKADAILTAENYDRFHHTLLESPKFASREHLELMVINSKTSSYDYLLNLRYVDLLETAHQKRRVELDHVEQTIHELEADKTGKQTWLNELEQAVALIREGIATDWDVQYELGAMIPKRKNSKSKA
jgi:DNA topoisomerase II